MYYCPSAELVTSRRITHSSVGLGEKEGMSDTKIGPFPNTIEQRPIEYLP